MAIDCCIILITLLFPPIGVAIVYGCGADLCINICLTILGYLPGHIHAFYLLATRPDPRVYGRPSGYQQQPYGVYQPPPPHHHHHHHQQQPQGGYYQGPPPPQQYGAAASSYQQQQAPPPGYKL